MEFDAQSGVIMDFTAVLFYPGGSTASFDCSFNHCGWRQWLEVNGTEGSLRCEDLVVPWHSSPDNKNYDERSRFSVTSAKRPWEKTDVEVEPCLAVRPDHHRHRHPPPHRCGVGHIRRWSW